MDYTTFINSLESRGINTTNLGNGEANFEQYASALSTDLKEELLASFGDEEGDYELQAKIASLFGSSSVMQSSDIIAAAKAAGIEVQVSYQSTSYIQDNKADGNYDTDVTSGAIAIYTFSDGNSTIKIADANGNGALETEEIYMNEILSGITSDLSASASSQSGQSDLIAQLENQLAETKARINESVNKGTEDELSNDEIVDAAFENYGKNGNYGTIAAIQNELAKNGITDTEYSEILEMAESLKEKIGEESTSEE